MGRHFAGRFSAPHDPPIDASRPGALGVPVYHKQKVRATWHVILPPVLTWPHNQELTSRQLTIPSRVSSCFSSTRPKPPGLPAARPVRYDGYYHTASRRQSPESNPQPLPFFFKVLTLANQGPSTAHKSSDHKRKSPPRWRAEKGPSFPGIQIEIDLLELSTRNHCFTRRTGGYQRPAEWKLT